jgi:hypothetical protein
MVHLDQHLARACDRFGHLGKAYRLRPRWIRHESAHR